MPKTKTGKSTKANPTTRGSNRKLLSAYVEPEVLQQVRVAAAKEGLDMSKWLREAISKSLPKN